MTSLALTLAHKIGHELKKSYQQNFDIDLIPVYPFSIRLGVLKACFELRVPPTTEQELFLRKAFQAIPDIQDIQLSFTNISLPGLGIGQIDRIVLVGAGKGGVGKSSLALSLAQALQQQGKKIGILDLDIYGPSLKLLLKLPSQPEIQQNTFIPSNVCGLKALSFGQMVEDHAPLIWRGPMLQKAVMQMLCQSLWGELDYLIIDLPPGTGDVLMAVAQNIHVFGVITVSSDHDLSLADVQRFIAACDKLGLAHCGLIANMVRNLPKMQDFAKQESLPLLGSLSFDSEFWDQGTWSLTNLERMAQIAKSF